MRRKYRTKKKGGGNSKRSLEGERETTVVTDDRLVKALDSKGVLRELEIGAEEME